MKDINKEFSTHVMGIETMENFIAYEVSCGASDNLIRRCSCAVKALFAYLPEDKTVTRERLLAWRKNLEERGYASATVLNYVKYINRYLDYVGASDIRFNRGKKKDISGMTFGYLTAIEPTGARDRKDIVWRCQCKCGNTVEIPATRLLTGNTLSCGCLIKEHLQRVNKYIDNTSLRQVFEEEVKSTRSVSGYTGITPKRGKWQVRITYKGDIYYLGCYADIEDAIKARTSAKELVKADAMELFNLYEEIHKSDQSLPSRATESKKEFLSVISKTKGQSESTVKRVDNASGYPGVSLRGEHWRATIGHKGVRYILGSFRTIEEAIQVRKQAEEDLKTDPVGFVDQYQKKYKYYVYRKKE